MRLQIYVPKAQAERWADDEVSFGQLQSRLVSIAGGVTVMQASGRWRGRAGFVDEAVLIVEVLVANTGDDGRIYTRVWNTLRLYANQLIRNGEESVLIVQDNEPTLIR